MPLAEVILVYALCVGVCVMVVAPLVWAIFTQHRDAPSVATAATPKSRVATARRARRPVYEPIVWPSR
jgi:ABC-type glycerol-3-phosphate transport system permease component